jgi:endonuclease/exonuclease/phosphatase (EEP) superfamily protein YafD
VPLFRPTTDADRTTLRIMARAAWATFTALALPLGLLGVAAYFASRPYVLAQLSPFRVQAATLLALHAVFCLTVRRRRWAAVFAVLACFNVWAVLRPAFPPLVTVTDTTRPPVKILFANVLTSNSDPARLLALIAVEAPDFVALIEINRRWQTQLEPALSATYPFSLFRPREDNFGLAVFSRVEPAGGRVEFFADVETPSLDLTLPSGDRSIRVLVTHPLPPGDAETAALRDQHLEGLADWMRFTATLQTAGTPPVPVLILGDFNATPWCPPLRRLLATTGLHSAARGHVVVASTWPVPIPFLRIPLDHALLNDELACIRYRVGPDIGSDHFPLLLEVRATAPFPPTPQQTP